MSEDAGEYGSGCQCRICVRGAVACMVANMEGVPLQAHDQIMALLAELEHAEMDRDVAESKLDGSWPGWEWLPGEIEKRNCPETPESSTERSGA